MSNSNNIYNILGKLDSLKPTAQEKHDATVKAIYESVEAQGSIIEGVDAVQAKLAKQFAESVAEVAPPGAKAERMVKGIKKSLSKDGHLSGKDKAIAYATTWKAHKKGQVEETGEICEACGMTESKCGCDHTNEDMSRAAKGHEKYGKKGMQALAKAGREGAGEKELDNIRNKHDQYNEAADECCCADLGQDECPVHCDEEPRRGVKEAEITRTDGKTVHRKTDFPGYPADDINDPDAEPTDRQRGRPRKHAVKAPTGLGRGRPVKAKAPSFSKQADPFGRVSGTVPKGTKGKVHSMSEAMDQLGKQLSQLTEGRYLEDATGESLNHILNRFRSEVKAFEQGNDLDQDLYDALYDYYVERGEMPYGVQKARTGDPMNWVAEKLDAELGDVAYGKDPANAETAEGMEMEAGIPGNLPAEQIPGKEDLLKGKGRSYYEEEVTMEDELNELARLAGLNTTEGNAFTGKLASTPKGGEFELDGKTFKDTSNLDETDLEEDDMEEGNEFSGELAKAKAQHKTEFEVDGKTYPVKEGMEMPGTSESDFNISTSMSSDGDKNVTVTATGEHAATLLQMLRIAGLGGGQAAQDIEAGQAGMGQPGAEVVVIDTPDEVMGEEGVEVDHPDQEPANAPNEKYGTIKNITTQGDDMNREKTQDPATANKAANPMTNAQGVLKAVAQLESKLAEEYESIKKVSK